VVSASCPRSHSPVRASAGNGVVARPMLPSAMSTVRAIRRRSARVLMSSASSAAIGRDSGADPSGFAASCRRLVTTLSRRSTRSLSAISRPLPSPSTLDS